MFDIFLTFPPLGFKEIAEFKKTNKVKIETDSSKLLPTFLEFKIGGTAYIDFRRGDSYSVKLARFYWTGF